MKEIRVLVWCDGPHENVNIGDGVQTYTVKIGTHLPTRALDLCPVCAKDYIGRLTELLAEKGVEPEPPVKVKRQSKPNPACPDCGHQATNRSALGAHLRVAHNKGLRDL